MVLERAACRWSVGLQVVGLSRQGLGRVASEEVILAQPLAWMNQNGPVVKALLEGHGLSPKDLIVIHDDLDLPIGRLRIKRSGGSGGHNGILSLLTVLGTDGFCRLKVGIGRPPVNQETAEYVLSPFTLNEKPIVETVLERAVRALECLLIEGIEQAMNRFNVRDQEEHA